MLSAQALKSVFSQLGMANGSLYLLARVLSRISGNRIRLIRYLLVAQPVPDAAAMNGRSASGSSIREVKEDDPVVSQFPRPPQVIAKRFADGATCLVAEIKGRFAGFIWLAHGGYDEDEVRCRYEFTRPEISVWDYDVYVEPKFRLGRTFMRLWDAANSQLAMRGIVWSFSRISAFNSGSLAVHGRMGACRLFSATFLCLGPIQITLAGAWPIVHIGLSNKTAPTLKLPPPR